MSRKIIIHTILVVIGAFFIPIQNAHAAPLEITTSDPLPKAIVGSVYNVPISASGGVINAGTGGYNLWVATGLPWSMDINPTTGEIYNTGDMSADTGLYTISVTVWDNTQTSNLSAAKSFSLRITDLNITSPPDYGAGVPSQAPAAVKGEPYSFDFEATGGCLPYNNWDITAGTLPKGLALDRNIGRIYGTPLEENYITSTFVVRLTDNCGVFVERKVSLTTVDFRITTELLPNAIAGEDYSQTITAEGGIRDFNGQYQWSASGLPASFDINPTTGGIYNTDAITPAMAGTYTVSVYATDYSISNPLMIGKTFNLTIEASPPPLRIYGPASKHFEPGDYIDMNFPATGGTPPYKWSIAGTIPDGTEFSPCSGSLSGLANSPGAYPITVTVTDSIGSSASISTDITVSLLEIKTRKMEHLIVGYPYSQEIMASGSSAPFTWTLTSGSLPTDLSLDTATGVISGIPTDTGSGVFGITVTDSTGYSLEALYEIPDWPHYTGLYTTEVPDAVVGAAYSFTLSGVTSLDKYGHGRSLWHADPSEPL
jgi:hypothetical protein